jgi:hypothetical protein
VKLSIFGAGDGDGDDIAEFALLLVATAEFELLPFDTSPELQADEMDTARSNPAAARLNILPAFVLIFLLSRYMWKHVG